ncbi:MAG TPA: PSD1 and planctomycete cytochrome C domain-containing protein [Pirellulales bacterium]|nr:PSD1 and planctomycete cytochrome C domain-containing protein [Pirellulales bacterium]
MLHSRVWPVRAALCLGLLTSSSALADAPRPPDYSRDIRPVLSNNCYKCHGPDETQRQAGLRLDQPEGATGQLESGATAVVPGNLAASALVVRITSANPDERMPPPASGKSLKPGEIELLTHWVEAGAEFRGHWSFLPPARVAPPQVRHEALVHNPIDRFLFARLEAEGLEPAAPADKVTLARRVTLDLTGLPPTPAEIEAFVGDTSSGAYEALVNGLLKSPRYGEHMARYWLDAARYGDTHGLHFDNERALWKYRDWVIEAFNRNLPFDQFTVEQLAGDLLPNTTLEQRIATGFNRCNVSTSEGGSIDDEVLVRYAVDRVETTSTVFMGLTMGCCVCHDHKFDPLTQKEFYQLFAFFSSVQEQAMDGNALAPPPIIKTPTAEQAARQRQLADEIASVRQQIAAELAKIEYVEPATAAGPPETREFVWIDDDLPPGAKPEGNTPWQFVTAPSPVLSGSKASTRKTAGVSQHFFTGAERGLRVGEGDKLFAYVYLDPQDKPKEVMLQFNDGSWEHRATWGDDVIPWGAAGSAGRMPMGPLPEAGQWVRLEVEAAKVGLAPGAVINGWAFTQHDGSCFWDKAGIVSRTPQAGESFDSQLAWEGYERLQSKSTLPQIVQDAVKVDAAARNDDQKKAVHDYFLEYVYGKTRGTFAPLEEHAAKLQKESTALDAAVPTTMVMQEMPLPRDAFVLVRGAYDKKGEQVAAGTPAVLPPMPDGAPRNRLGLAQWLVQPSHPLTARVAVNRFWQQYFGTGIVKTAGDFGAQGQWPTHPELLDWLATEFVGSGWNVKHLQKLVVMSYAYQQSSRATPQLLERDPENLLLARGPRFRLDAEVVRDAALAASGLLVEQLGGHSVKPYQPEGVWEAVAFVGSNTSMFQQDQGDALYRRSLYTFWKRTAPPPSLTTFDAPSRETCTVRRARTNTPLQALVLMNDKQYVEAARKLAERALGDGGATVESRIAHAFRLATARLPAADELAVLVQIHQGQLAEYQADKEAAAKLLAVGDSKRDEKFDASELAAYTMVANLILNLDETITKE